MGGSRGGRARRWPDNFDRIAKETSAVLLDAMPDFLDVASSNTFHSHCLCCYMLKRFDVLILISMFVMFSCLVLRTIYYAQTIVEGKGRAATTHTTKKSIISGGYWACKIVIMKPRYRHEPHQLHLRYLLSCTALQSNP